MADQIYHEAKATMNGPATSVTGTEPVRFDDKPEELAGHVLSDLTAAFIHEMMQPLSAIASNAAALQRLLGKGISRGEILEIANDVSADARRVGYLLHRFRTAVGRHPGRLRPIDISKVILNLQDVFSRDFPNRVTFQLQEGAWEVTGDFLLLCQLFENLIRNALDAIESHDDGLVRVATSVDQSARLARIVIQDNGCGIASNVLPRIFDPDYTTKPRGLGIGLHIVRRAVALHGGTITCRSEMDKGTEFTVLLPIKDDTLEQ